MFEVRIARMRGRESAVARRAGDRSRRSTRPRLAGRAPATREQWVTSVVLPLPCGAWRPITRGRDAASRSRASAKEQDRQIQMVQAPIEVRHAAPVRTPAPRPSWPRAASRSDRAPRPPPSAGPPSAITRAALIAESLIGTRSYRARPRARRDATYGVSGSAGPHILCCGILVTPVRPTRPDSPAGADRRFLQRWHEPVRSPVRGLRRRRACARGVQPVFPPRRRDRQRVGRVDLRAHRRRNVRERRLDRHDVQRRARLLQHQAAPPGLAHHAVLQGLRRRARSAAARVGRCGVAHRRRLDVVGPTAGRRRRQPVGRGRPRDLLCVPPRACRDAVRTPTRSSRC